MWRDYLLLASATRYMLFKAIGSWNNLLLSSHSGGGGGGGEKVFFGLPGRASWRLTVPSSWKTSPLSPPFPILLLDLLITANQYRSNPLVNGFDDLTNCCNN